MKHLCHDERHATPCTGSAPCTACEDECDPAMRVTSECWTVQIKQDDAPHPYGRYRYLGEYDGTLAEVLAELQEDGYDIGDLAPEFVTLPGDGLFGECALSLSTGDLE